MDRKIDLSNYKPRIIDKRIQESLEVFGALCVEGPKWCGKTWSSAHNAKSEIFLGDPTNNFYNRKMAELSIDFVLNGETPRLIDEWQEFPAIWDAVRYAVDFRGKKGQFLLTGSSTPKLKGILHSGAGRIGSIRMRTMSLYESGDSSGLVSLKELLEGKIINQATKEVGLMDLAHLIVRGGFPSMVDLDSKTAQASVKGYIDGIIANDLPRINGEKYSIPKMRLLLKSLARNESTTATKNKLVNDIKEENEKGIDRETVSAYLDLLDRVFLLDNQNPYSYNVRSSIRVKQGEKRHFCDPSITCALLNINDDKLIKDLETFGLLFEALVVRDLKVYAASLGLEVYHYQNYANMEADAVIELDDGNWCAFEVKLGFNQVDSAAKNLIKLRDSIANDGGKAPSILCVIVGLCNAAYQREDGVFVVPITALKD